VARFKDRVCETQLNNVWCAFYWLNCWLLQIMAKLSESGCACVYVL